MTRLPELLEEAVGDLRLDFGIDDLAPRVTRRRRARRIRIVSGLVVVVALTATVVTTTVARGRSSAPQVRVNPTVPPSSPDIVVFDDAGGILTVDVAARAATHRPIQGWRPGDQPFLSLRVADDFVVGWGDVYAAPIGSQRSRRLGTGVFVPAVEPGDVWLTSYGQVQTRTERLVDMQGRVVLQGPAPDEPPVTGIPGGLVLDGRSGLDLWDARTGRVTRHLGTTAAPVASAFGSLLAWCDRCDRALELTDVKTGVTRSIAIALHGEPASIGGFAFSPDGAQLGVVAAPDGAAPIGVTTRVIIVNVASGAVTNEIDSSERYASIAWSPDSRRVYVAATDNGTGGELFVHDQVTNRTRDLGRLPDGAGNLSAAMTRGDYARMPSAPAGPAGACRPLGPANDLDANRRLCRFGF